MPCYQPLQAWRDKALGAITFHQRTDTPETEWIPIPCGKCVECRSRRAREWAIRCQFELQRHPDACWVTLTYDPEHCPPTLRKLDLVGYIKRLRARLSGSARLRFFASGEYGESTERPHYHSILFGVARENRHVVDAWPFGYARADVLTPAAIAYVAGYAAKKLAPVDQPQELVDPSTGEVLDEDYQPPFLQMSRNPGIGSDARRFARSWRSTAILPGSAPMPVPRYLHNAWLKSATDEEVKALREERLAAIARSDRLPGWKHARRAQAETRHQLQARGRTL